MSNRPVVTIMVLVGSVFSTIRSGQLLGTGRWRKPLLLRFLFLCFGHVLQRHPSQGRLCSGLVFLSDLRDAIFKELGFICNSELCMLLQQVRDGYWKLRILNKIGRELFAGVFRLGNVIDLHVYDLVHGVSCDDSVWYLLNRLSISLLMHC